MTYRVKKVKNCFKNAETYEYTTNITNNDLLSFFSSMGNTSLNGDGDGRFFVTQKAHSFRIIGLLKSDTFKVSFFGSATDKVKTEFETELNKFFGELRI